MRDRRAPAPEQCCERFSVRAALLRRAVSFPGRQGLVLVGADPKRATGPLWLRSTRKAGRGCVARQGRQLRLVALEGADKTNHVLAHCGSQYREFPLDPLSALFISTLAFNRSCRNEEIVDPLGYPEPDLRPL
jgi:hypothetical protein